MACTSRSRSSRNTSPRTATSRPVCGMNRTRSPGLTFRASPAIDHPNGDKDLLDAEDMLEFVLGRPFEDDDEIEARSLARFRRLVERRVAGEPAAYITGRITFHGLKLVVGRGAFIPR